MLEDSKIAFSVRRQAIEASAAGGLAGHRFWLFVFNLFASCLLLLAFLFWHGVLVGVIGTIVVAGAMWFVNIDRLWVRITNWRRVK